MRNEVFRLLVGLVVCWAIGNGAPAHALWEYESGEHYVTVGGFFNTGSAIRISSPANYFISLTEYEPPAIVGQQNQLRLAFDGSHPGGVYTRLNLDLVVAPTPDHPFDNVAQFEVDEAYVDFRVRDVDWRVGREKVIWGKADLLSPFDVLTARDLKDPFVNDTIQDRIAQWGVRAAYGWSDYNLQAAFYPIWSRSRSPEARTVVDPDGTVRDTEVDAWFPPVGILPTFALQTGDIDFPWFIFLTTYNQVEYPDRDLESAAFGARLNMLRGAWDTDLYYLTTIDPVPHPEIRGFFFQTAFQGQNALQLEIDGRVLHSRLHTWGGATSTTWGRLAFRGEFAFTSGNNWYRLFDEEQVNELVAEFEANPVAGGQLRDTVAEHSSIKLIAGGDIEIPNTGITTSNQLAINHGFGHKDVYFQAATEVSMTNMVRRSWLADHLTVSWTDLVNFTGSSVYLRPAVSYVLPAFEDLQVGAAFNVFVGEDFSFVGQYGDHSSLLLTARLYF